MKTFSSFLLMNAAAALCAVTARPQAAGQTERVAAAFVLALGRAPSAGEIGHWAEQGPHSVAELMARQREKLRADAETRRATVRKAWQDAFGCEPTEGDATSGPGGGATYTELIQRHIQWLSGHPAEYEKVIQRAYQFLFRREAYPLELDYWKGQSTLSYALLAGCLDDWARRNQPGLMVTGGTATVSVNCIFLTTIRLSPSIAAEARAAAGLEPSTVSQSPSGSGHNLVAAGAAGIVTAGGMHFVAAGASGDFAPMDHVR